jgi:5'-deoxynucleotidase YfbR-like HD superfamily hydrolase
MKSICSGLGSLGGEIFDLWESYEKQEDYDSNIGFQIDKLQAVLKAFEYEEQGEKVSTQEFIDYLFEHNYITNDFLLNKLKEVQEKLQLIKSNLTKVSLL